jgi:hypothetical protein
VLWLFPVSFADRKEDFLQWHLPVLLNERFPEVLLLFYLLLPLLSNILGVLIQQDLSTHRCSYWRRTHQLPGVSFCPIHKVPLVLVDAPLALLKDPHESIKVLQQGKGYPSALEQRLVSLWQALLELDTPVHYQVAARLIKAGMARHHIYSVSGAGRISLAEKLHAEADSGWLVKYFGDPRRLTATARSNDPMAAKWYALALALLYESTDDVLFYLTGQRRARGPRLEQVRRALGAYAAGMPFLKARELAGGAAAAHFEESLRALAREVVQ